MPASWFLNGVSLCIAPITTVSECLPNLHVFIHRRPLWGRATLLSPCYWWGTEVMGTSTLQAAYCGSKSQSPGPQIQICGAKNSCVALRAWAPRSVDLRACASTQLFCNTDGQAWVCTLGLWDLLLFAAQTYAKWHAQDYTGCLWWCRQLNPGPKSQASILTIVPTFLKWAVKSLSPRGVAHLH